MTPDARQGFAYKVRCYAPPTMADEGTKGARTDDLPGQGTDAEFALRAAQQAFERGDYAEVRRLTSPLVKHRDVDVARFAHDLQRRVQVDPAQVVALILCFLFFGWVTWKYVLS